MYTKIKASESKSSCPACSKTSYGEKGDQAAPVRSIGRIEPVDAFINLPPAFFRQPAGRIQEVFLFTIKQLRNDSSSPL